MFYLVCFFFFKQKSAYEMRISDWSSDVCSSDLRDEMISNPTLPSMHGGILASLIDLTGFYTVLASGSMSKSTADLRVDYHRAASRQTLLAEGRLIKAGRSLSVADVRIHDEAGTLVASGRGAYNM